jgi:hypothetical protein
MITVARTQRRNGRRSEPSTKLSKEDRQHLRNYKERCGLLWDRTISVSQSYQTGVYIVGSRLRQDAHGRKDTVKRGIPEFRGFPFRTLRPRTRHETKFAMERIIYGRSTKGKAIHVERN